MQTDMVQETGMSEWVDTPESSHVDAIRYEPDTQDCYVRFQGDGSVYRYRDVPPNVWDQFLESGSKGRFVNIVLKRQYLYERIN